MQKRLETTDNSELYTKFLELNQKYESFELYDKKAAQEKRKIDLIKSKAQLLKEFLLSRDNIYNNTISKIDKQAISQSLKEVSSNIIWNSLESVEVAFDLVEVKKYKLEK